MQESFWWWQCSDRYIISLSPTSILLPPISPSLISLMVSVDVKHNVYLLTYLMEAAVEKRWSVTVSDLQAWSYTKLDCQTTLCARNTSFFRPRTTVFLAGPHAVCIRLEWRTDWIDCEHSSFTPCSWLGRRNERKKKERKKKKEKKKIKEKKKKKKKSKKKEKEKKKSKKNNKKNHR